MKMKLKKIKGATMIEYVLIATLISIAGYLLLSDVGGGISQRWANVGNAVNPGG